MDNAAQQLATLSVLAGAYRKGSKTSMLTHTVRLATGEVLCKRVQADNMADLFSASAEEQVEAPTCPQCLARDPRF